jgi:hypothetical protein
MKLAFSSTTVLLKTGQHINVKRRAPRGLARRLARRSFAILARERKGPPSRMSKLKALLSLCV